MGEEDACILNGNFRQRFSKTACGICIFLMNESMDLIRFAKSSVII